MRNSFLWLALLAGSVGTAAAQSAEPVALAAPAPATDSVYTGPRLALGVVAGANYASFLGSDATTNWDVRSRWDYHAGITADIRMGSQLTLHPEVRYSRKGADFPDSRLNCTLSYLDVPVLVRYHSSQALGANAVYLEAGPQASLLLAAKTGTKADAKDDFRTLLDSFVLGAGYRWANGLSLGVRYEVGISDVYSPIPPEASQGRGNYQPNAGNNVFSASLGYSLNVK